MLQMLIFCERTRTKKNCCTPSVTALPCRKGVAAVFCFGKNSKNQMQKRWMNAISLAARAGTASSRRTGRAVCGIALSMAKPPA